MTNIVSGKIIALFAFDIGYEVSMDELARFFPSFPAQPLSSKKQTPPYLQYTTPPLRLGLEPAGPLFDQPGEVTLTVFDFAAASIAYTWQITDDSRLTIDGSPLLAQGLYGLKLEQDARRRMSALMASISQAVERPDLSPLVEDYYLFIFEKLASPVNCEELLAQHRQALAQLLRLETGRLSVQQQNDALSLPVSYYDSDLVLIDWNTAVIIDPDYEDTVNVLELLNIELLEARYVDAQLDRHIQQYSGIVHKSRVPIIPFIAPYRKTIQELAELRTEALLLEERTENSLKLVGDLYLARIHSAAAERFHLKEWDLIIANKIEIITNFYNLLTDRVRNAQSQALEVVVVILILVELLVALFRFGH